MLNLASPEDTLYLCTSVQKEKEYLFDLVYRRFDRSFFHYTESMPVVHLTVHPSKERDELYENINSPLPVDPEKFGNMDALYLNMVTGYDIEIEKLEEIRKVYKKLLYLDIHTLSRGYDETGRREFRIIPDADRWIRSADIIQVNESELFTLSNKKNENEIISDVLHSGPQQLIITMGHKGVRIYYLKRDEINSLYLSAIKINTLNKVGCGDVFGAVYFYYYSKCKNILESLKRANIAAGLTASYEQISEFSRLNDDILSRYY